MIIIKALSVLVFITNCASAQSKYIEIFSKSITKLQSLKSINYSIHSIDENPFAQSDITTATRTEELIFNTKGDISYKRTNTNINSGQNVLQEIYNNGRLYSISITDSTYTDEVPKSPVLCDIKLIKEMMKSELLKAKSRIVQKIDTVYDGRKCYNFLIKQYDTISNGNHDYTYKLLLIDQKSLLPIYLQTTGSGAAYKEGLSFGRLNFHNEQSLKNININRKVISQPFVNHGFSYPNTKSLEVGDKAPDVIVKNTLGENMPIEIFKNKVLLVIFGGTACPANPLANPMLNRLQTKFATSNFLLANIYTNETGDQVNKYSKTNNLMFPVYLGSTKLKKAFQTLGTPHFYLINSEGKIVKAVLGYSDSLEESLIKSINELMPEVPSPAN